MSIRWPFGREYPLNPALNDPPVKYTVRDSVMGEETERSYYIPTYSTATYRQKTIDEKVAKVIYVTGAIFTIAGFIALGFYLGKRK